MTRRRGWPSGAPRAVVAMAAMASKRAASPTLATTTAALAPAWRAAVTELRAAILASNPAVTEHVKWNAPSLCDGGDDRVTFRFPPRGGVQLILHRGAKPKDTRGFRFVDPTGLIAWAAPDRGVVTFTQAAQLRARRADLVALVNAWLAATRGA